MSLASELGDRFRVEFAGKTVSVVSGAILTILLARLLNPGDYGLLFLALSVLGTIQLFSKLGIAKSASRYVAEYKETDRGQVPHILRFSFLLNVATIAIICILLLITGPFISGILGEQDLSILLLYGIYIVVFGTAMAYARHILQGFEYIQGAAVLLMVDRVTRLIIVLGLVLFGYGAIGAIIGYAVAHMVASAIGLFYIYWEIYSKIQPVEIESGIRRRIAEYTIPLTATNAASILEKADTILVGFFLGPISVAYYTIGKQVITFLETPMSALGFTISPTYGAQISKGNTETAAKIYEDALIHGLLLYIPATAGLLLVAGPIVELIFGSQYLGGVQVLQVLTVYAVLKSITEITGRGLDYLGRARERAIAKGATSILNIVLNIILIPWIGVVGAAISTVGAYSIYTFINIYVMYIEITFNKTLVARKVLNISLIALAMSVFIYPMSIYVTGIFTLILVICVGFTIWLILAIITGMLDINRISSILL